jgi:hypothetical protein
MQDTTIAVVGCGFGSLMVFSTAVYVGFDQEQLAIYGPSETPVTTYSHYAHCLGQTVLRSESESHFLPADWPTFAQLDAWVHKNPTLLLRSIRRRYNPGLEQILAEAETVASRLGWQDRRIPDKVGWIERVVEPAPHFRLYGEDTQLLGKAKHVLIGIGHGPLTYPRVLAEARENPALADRIVQAYETKTYERGGRYIVIGAGIAGVNEWANGLEAGAKVISLLRNPAPEEQDLNTPRCFFEAYGVDAYQELTFDQRVAFLGSILKGTSPTRRNWVDIVRDGIAEDRFDQLIGEVDEVKAGPAGLSVHASSKHGPDPGWFDVTGIVCGTGFTRSALAVPVIRRLVDDYGVPVEDGRLRLRSNCGVPGLDRADSRLCVSGLLANTVIPHGDTIAGVKYIARRFVADCSEAERIRRRGFFSRVRLQLSLANAAGDAMRKAEEAVQLS